ncbi:MAG: PLP-dependent aminotransferase family protein [Clostridiales bacterium]|jgi:GntR family transcriptional regulator/MocR family aminotransferase|nr:PLP-dependent aminotransferase family protein [Clostridiales bacterium]
MLVINESSKTPLYIQLYQQIKSDIFNGALKPGTKLMSSRTVSEELHISRNTVKLAYDQLFAEGIIASVQRKGYYVESLDVDAFPHNTCLCSVVCNCADGCTCSGGCVCEVCARKKSSETQKQDIVYDFRCDKPLLFWFPCNQWQRLINKCFHEYREDFACPKAVFGETGLRTEIQRFIHSYRDVDCTVEQIVLTMDTQFCLDIVCQLLKPMDKEPNVAVEEPGLDQSRITFQNNGLRICPMELDQHGAVISALTKMDVIAAYLTPSHQFPTGVVMPLPRRNEVAEWAMRKDAYIIEDDYNCYFQYGVRPLPSLQSLCADRTFYINSFSNILFPCINVSYMVVPEKLLARLHNLFDNHGPFVSFLTQKPLELFMKEGLWESHLRKVRKNQNAKCETLVNALKNRFGDSISISGSSAGLHLLVHPNWTVTEDALINCAHQAGVGVSPISGYWIKPERKQDGTVLLNYAGIALKDIPAAVNLLYEAWREM